MKIFSSNGFSIPNCQTSAPSQTGMFQSASPLFRSTCSTQIPPSLPSKLPTHFRHLEFFAPHSRRYVFVRRIELLFFSIDNRVSFWGGNRRTPKFEEKTFLLRWKFILIVRSSGNADNQGRSILTLPLPISSFISLSILR